MCVYTYTYRYQLRRRHLLRYAMLEYFNYYYYYK